MKRTIVRLLPTFVLILALITSSCSLAAVFEKKAGPDPEAFELTEIDDAAHVLPDGEVFEWWYFDAAFDNGYSMVSSWQMANMKINNVLMPLRVIQFAIYEPDGKKTAVSPMFPVTSYSASQQSCDVTMGTNHLQGKYPLYEMNFLQGDIGCQLSFENLTQGFRNPPAGVTHFSEKPDRYIGWAIAQPRASVTGKLILNGKEIPVSGQGYHDHNWGNAPLPDMYTDWYWGRIFLSDYTFVYSVGETSDVVGKRPTSAIVAFKGKKLVDLSDKIYADVYDLELDKYTGAKYPKKLVIRVESPVTKGEIVHRLQKLVESQLTPMATEGGGRGYLRFLSDCDVRLNVAGEKVEVSTPLIHEYMIP